MPYLIYIVIFILAASGVTSAHADAVPPRVLYVATTGADNNPGTPDKPVATLAHAKEVVRRWIAAGLSTDVQVRIGSGNYYLSEPLHFDTQDSGTKAHSITYAAVDGETVVISGGRRITGWQSNDNGLWSVVIPEVAAGQWYFRELYVNGRRASRTRSPSLIAKEPYFRVQESKLSPDLSAWEIKLAPPARVVNWKNLADVELVAFRQREITRKPICSAIPDSAVVALCPPHGTVSNALLGAGTFCCLENAAAFLRQPGEWYLDRSNGELRYWPRANEDLTQAEVIAPFLTQLIQITGSRTNPVQNLHFRGLTFSHATWTPPTGGFNGFQAGFYLLPTPTGSSTTNRLDAAISLEFAEACRIQNCEIAHVGGPAVELHRGCRDNLLDGNHLQDVGANGLMVGEAWDWTDPADAVLSNRLVNNLIHHCGVTDFGAVGVWVGFAQNTLVAHNLLRDLPATGISIGWQWGKQETNCRTNVVLLNNIYNVGLLMADAGGIYTVGQQPGTTIRENVLHDLDHGRQPAAGLYFDEGGPDGFLVESNLVYDTAGPLVADKAWNAWRTNNRFRDNILARKGTFPAGIVGVGMLFNNDSYLDRPHELALDPTNLTVEAWVKFLRFPTEPDPCVWIINKNGDELTDGNYALAVSHCNVGAYLNIGGGRDNCYFTWSSGNPISSNGWNHLAMTYDGRDLRVYCNGRLAGFTAVNRQAQTTDTRPQTMDSILKPSPTRRGSPQTEDRSRVRRDDAVVGVKPQTPDSGLRTQDSSSPNSQLPTTSSQLTSDLRPLTASPSSGLRSQVSSLSRSPGTGALRIGKRDDRATAFTGLMDEIRIYNRALSAEEIKAGYTEIIDARDQSSEVRGLPRPERGLQSQVSSLQSNCVAYWPFDDLKIQFDQTVATAGPEEPYRTRWHLDQKKNGSPQSEVSDQRPAGDTK